MGDVEKPNTTIRLGDTEYDIARAVPLTLGDWHRLEQRGVTIKSFQQMEDGDVSFSTLFHMMCVLLQKVDPSLRDEDVGQLHPEDIGKLDIFVTVAESEAPITTANPS